MMKKTYQAPVCEAMMISNEDILTLSVGGSNAGTTVGWGNPDSIY